MSLNEKHYYTNSNIPSTPEELNVTKTITHREVSSEQEQSNDVGLNQKSIRSHQSTLNASVSSSGGTKTSSTDDDDSATAAKKLIKQKSKSEKKQLRKVELKEKKQTSKIRDSVDEDDNNEITKQKQKTTETKTKKKSVFIRCFQEQSVDDDDDDDDGVRKRKRSFKKQISNKSNSSTEECGENQTGRRAAKTGGTYPMVILSERPSIDNANGDNKSLANNTDGTNSQPSTPESPPIHSDNQKIPINIRNKKHRKSSNKSDYETILPNEIHIERTNSSDSSSRKSPNKSYCKSQQCLPTDISSQGHKYSKIKKDTNRLLIVTPLQSIMKAIRSFSTHTSVQQIQKDINFAEIQKEKERTIRKKRARTRWFVAYTLIRNPSLTSLRKRALEEEKLRRLIAKQTTQFNQQMFNMVDFHQESVSVTNNIKSETSSNCKMRTEAKISTGAELRLLPISNINGDIWSPSKQLISIHA